MPESHAEQIERVETLARESEYPWLGKKAREALRTVLQERSDTLKALRYLHEEHSERPCWICKLIARCEG